MPIIPIPDFYPGPIPHDDRARNGKVPDWLLPASAAYRINFANQHQRKVVFTKTTAVDNVPTGQATQQVPWRWKCHTGHNTQNADTITLRAVATMLPADNVASTDAKWRFVADDGVTTSNSAYRHVGGIVPPSGGGPEVVTTADIQATTVSITGLKPNTEYDCHVEIEDYCRLLTLTVYELAAVGVDTAHTTAVADNRPYGFESEITDAQHGNLYAPAYALWRANAAHIANLVPETESGFWTRTTNTYANLLDQTASTTVGANTPGIRAQLQYHEPAHKDTVTCVFAVFGRNVSLNAGGQVKLVDSNGDISGSELTSFTAATTGEWKKATVEIPANAAHKLDVQFAGDNTDSFQIRAVSLYEYAT